MGTRSTTGWTKTPSLRGQFMVDTTRGVIRVRSWPRRRGQDATSHLSQWQEWLRALNWAWRYLPGLIKRYYIEAAKPPYMQARDLFFACMYGSMFAITTTDGRRIYPMAALETLSQTLDIFGSKTGHILARYPDYWRTVEPGTEGYVLTSHGQVRPPTWEPIPQMSGIQTFWSAGMFDPQGSLSVTKTWPNGVVTVQWHMSAQNYVSLNVQRPSNAWKAKLGTLVRFPSTATGSVALYWKVGGFRPGVIPPNPNEQIEYIGSPGAGIYVWYYSNFMDIPADAQYVTLEWGRRGDLSGDSYGDYVHAACFSVEYQ